MSPTTARKLGYPLILLVYCLVAFGVMKYFHWSTTAKLSALVVILLPGRLQAWLLRDFFRGRREMSRGEYDRARESFQTFLARLKARPLIKHSIWLSYAVYSTDIEAMTENNLGACSIEMGSFAEATKHLKRALEIDQNYAIPYVNLAAGHQLSGEPELAEECLAKARSLGYSGGSSDQALSSLSERYAQMQKL